MKSTRRRPLIAARTIGRRTHDAQLTTGKRRSVSCSTAGNSHQVRSRPSTFERSPVFVSPQAVSSPAPRSNLAWAEWLPSRLSRDLRNNSRSLLTGAAQRTSTNARRAGGASYTGNTVAACTDTTTIGAIRVRVAAPTSWRPSTNTHHPRRRADPVEECVGPRCGGHRKSKRHRTAPRLSSWVRLSVDRQWTVKPATAARDGGRALTHAPV